MDKKYFKVTFEEADPVSKEVHTHTPVYSAKNDEDAIERCVGQIDLYGFFKDYKVVSSIEVK